MPAPDEARDCIIAIVDDDAGVRNSLQFALEVEGFGVRVYSGAQAMLDDGRFGELSCIVVDQNMPAISGLELIARLRALSVLVPVVLITGQPSAVLSLRARKAGVAVVEKPLLGNALVDQIRVMTAHG